MSLSHMNELDIEDHDGSAKGLYLAGTLVTASAAEINSRFDSAAQTLTDDGEITVKNGVCLLNKAGVIAATLPDPVAADNYKRLRVFSLTAQLHTLTPGTPFGNGGAGMAKASFSGVIGDSIDLMAYGGYWYILGVHQVTIGVA